MKAIVFSILLFIGLLLAGTVASDNTSACNLTLPTKFQRNYSPEWDAVIHAINVCKAKQLTIYSTGTGGLVSMGRTFIDSVENFKAQGHKQVIFILKDGNYSMHAIAACSADKWIMRPGAFMMFHMIRDSFTGAAYIDDTKAFLRYCGDYVDQYIWDHVLAGEDVYVTYD